MKFDVERLYNLLPAVYRIRDASLQKKEGEVPPLKALISILAEELDNIEENLDQLYDDQFIETCDEWAIPYIGELIGIRQLIDVPDFKFSPRAEVANTIAYRRRKGTASIIEQLARDVTNWDTNVVEYFQFLATTQYMNHIRSNNIAVSRISKNPYAKPNQNDWEYFEYANTPFDQMPKTADIRSIETNRGKYNIQNIGVFLWKTNSNAISLANAYRIDRGRYTFHQLGMDISLYNESKSEDTITQLATRDNVPFPISRRQLYEDLDTYLNQEPDKKYTTKYIKTENNSSEINKIAIIVGSKEVTPDKIRICNLCNNSSGKWNNLPQASGKVVIDPELGRIAFPPDFSPAPIKKNVKVSYNYGFGLPIGGGSYDRKLAGSNFSSLKKIVKVPSEFNKIQSAINSLGSEGGTIEIEDNSTYSELVSLNIDDIKHLCIKAKDGCRPTLILQGDMTISGGANSIVEINGLLIDGGSLIVEPGCQLQKLNIIHTTIRPKADGNEIRIWPVTTELSIDKSIVSGIRISKGANAIIKDSIVDVTSQSRIAYDGLNGANGGNLIIENSTIVGRVNVKQIELASNCIFTSPITTTEIQKGCVRFSYFPWESITPKAYKCQPKLSGIKGLKPTYSSRQYGHPQYLQLDYSTPLEFLNGADNGSEMGAYYQQFTPQKIAYLRLRLNEYLRFGLEAGIFLVS